MPWDAPRVEAELRRRGIAFRRHDVLHGRQLRISSGELINVYPNGVVEVGGVETELATSLSEVFAGPARSTYQGRTVRPAMAGSSGGGNGAQELERH